MKKISIGILLMVLALMTIVGFTIGHYIVNYQYERSIGSFMENAYNMNTPSRMKEQLVLAEDGIKKAGLTEDMYGAWIFKKPDNSMQYQYQHLDSIIERVSAVEVWYNTVYGNGTVTGETMNDVYEQKMDNLRGFIMEGGRSDWIARDTWFINNHFFWYLPVYIIYLLAVIMGIAGLAFLMTGL